MAWQFGIKEVADVTFTPLGGSGKSLYFDTLKVSNLEFTSEEAFARGGKGNPKLITWDYNREATLTIQDALLSMETLAMIFGDTNGGASDTVSIGADTYPGYYKVEGSTYARGTDGTEKVFKFTIHKAKISSNVTLTMEAEGDPTVFDMTITVLKAEGKDELVSLELEDMDKDQKVSVTLVSTTGEVTNYVLSAGEAWPTSITPASYTNMPDKVAGGTYYAKA
jgi:hypothetical protein